MKKRALRKDFYMEIIKSRGRFLSIFFIVALGVAFFSGIRSAEPDMRVSGDYYFDEKKLMDIKAMSSMGLTEEDLDAIAKLKGVDEVEGGYSTDVLCEINDSQKVLHMMSILPSMNQLTVSEGRLPEKEGECLVDQDFLEGTGYKVGDTIKLESGNDDPLSDTVKHDTYKIVGIGSSSCYISFSRGSSMIGTGEVSGFLAVLPEAFELDVYTEAYVTVSGAKELTAFTDAYEKKVETVLERVESIADTRCEIRKDDILEEANEELDDAKKELADGKKEADEKLAEAKAELEDGEQQLIDGKQQIQDGTAALEDGKAQLYTKQKELEDAKAQYESGLAQLESGKAELAAQEAEFDRQADAAYAQLEDGERQLAQAKEEMVGNWSNYLSGAAQLDAVKETISTLEAVIQSGQASPEELAAAQEQLAMLNALVAQQEPLLESTRQQLEAGDAALDAKAAELAAARSQTEAQLAEGKAALEAGRSQLAASEAQLAEAGNQLASGQSQIDSAWSEIHSQEKALVDARAELAEKEPELADGKAEYEKAKAEAEAEIKDGERKIADAEAEIKEIESPKWYVYDRDTLTEYTGYGENADRMRAIGEVFPVLFFLVAALISLTTMTRMVEEQRTQIGTLKALGYSKFSIAGKYLNYALAATIGGSICGVLVGEKLLPYIIIYSYGIMYRHMPDIIIPYNLDYAIMATVAAVACTTLAALVSCYKELAAEPAELMRPPSPKQGKRVFIERITFIWKHLSFIWKSTIRNLIRYKKRFFMTVFGIGGCMSLILVGFGLRDSIFDIALLQYDQIQKYDATAYLREEASAAEHAELSAYLEEETALSSHTESYMKLLTIGKGKTEKEAYICVPENEKQFGEFVIFRDRITKEAYELTDEGAILTEKMAKMLGAEAGDEIYIMDDKRGKIPVEITDICENYMGHYIYLSEGLYEKLYGYEPEYNSILLKLKEFDEKKMYRIGEEILSYPAALNVSYMNNVEGQLNDMLDTLDLVIVVLIISAGMLAFVVLYNLNNINITERKRELATIKVLGFYDKEVAAYVYRENVLLTLIGSAAGCIMGYVLHQFVVVTVEVDAVMFGRNINPISFVYSLLFTIGFSAFVNWVMYFKLKKIDMVESLKSVE